MNSAEDKWIIFDADNTLWQTEVIYNEARNRLCDYIHSASGIAKEQIEAFQRDTDKKLEALYGYSASRFARSFEDTLINYLDSPEADEIRHVRRLAEDVFRKKAAIYPGVEEVLRTLRANHWKLAIITAGEEWVQKKRLSEFHLETIFDEIIIIERKNSSEFSNFCKNRKFDPAGSWVVGDSLRSDVLPAIEAGFKAIWVQHDNWREVERAGLEAPAGCVVVQSIARVLAELSLTAIDGRPIAQDDLDVFGLFEGGGAKGLAHVGALKAAEERQVKFRGVAGTSAGSIIAGLIAVGYTADELFSEHQPAALPFSESYLRFFGHDEWQKGKELWSNAAGLADKLKGEAWGVTKAYAWIKLGFLLKGTASQQAVESLGYFSAEAFKQWYNRLLEAKIQKKGPDRTVRFSDVDFNLKIVSADVSAAELVVHSRETCPNRPIADAVAASISIPLFFQPQKIEDGHLHVDGGILSNFPAWLFFDEINQEKDTPILGFELIDEKKADKKLDLFGYLEALVGTAISGKKRIEVRGLDNIYTVSIPVVAQTFDFDMKPEEMKRTFKEGYDALKAFFPETVQLVTQRQMAPYLFTAYEEMLAGIGRPVHLRVNVMDRTPLGRIAIRYRFNMDFDADDFMDFPDDAGAVARCHKERKTQLVDLERAKRGFADYNMSKYNQALVRQSLKSLMTVPIFDPRGGDVAKRPLLGVLNFDSDDAVLEDFARQSNELVVDLARMVAYAWIEIASRGPRTGEE
jgi:predicted acylesterase/phospholipase RssA/FMN phosphatase YigB (HAD superfamily)